MINHQQAGLLCARFVNNNRTCAFYRLRMCRSRSILCWRCKSFPVAVSIKCSGVSLEKKTRTWADHVGTRARETRGETSRLPRHLATRLVWAGWATWEPLATSTPSCRPSTSRQSSEVRAYGGRPSSAIFVRWFSLLSSVKCKWIDENCSYWAYRFVCLYHLNDVAFPALHLRKSFLTSSFIANKQHRSANP